MTGGSNPTGGHSGTKAIYLLNGSTVYDIEYDTAEDVRLTSFAYDGVSLMFANSYTAPGTDIGHASIHLLVIADATIFQDPASLTPDTPDGVFNDNVVEYQFVDKSFGRTITGCSFVWTDGVKYYAGLQDGSSSPNFYLYEIKFTERYQSGGSNYIDAYRYPITILVNPNYYYTATTDGVSMFIAQGGNVYRVD
jgi:hypothetical protein